MKLNEWRQVVQQSDRTLYCLSFSMNGTVNMVDSNDLMNYYDKFHHNKACFSCLTDWSNKIIRRKITLIVASEEISTVIHQKIALWNHWPPKSSWKCIVKWEKWSEEFHCERSVSNFAKIIFLIFLFAIFSIPLSNNPESSRRFQNIHDGGVELDMQSELNGGRKYSFD